MSKTGIQYLESGIHSLESTMQDCSGFPYMGVTLKTLYKRKFTVCKKSNDFDGLVLKAKMIHFQ